MPGDLADPDYAAGLAAAHADAFEHLSCLVLNAGVGTGDTIGDLAPQRLDKTIAVNLRAPFVLLQQRLPLLRVGSAADPERGARVVALASITGAYAEPGLAAYGATKAAILSLVETLNAEESGNGITATALAPGYVETDMTAWVRDQVPAEEMIPVRDLVDLVDVLVALSARPLGRVAPRHQPRRHPGLQRMRRSVTFRQTSSRVPRHVYVRARPDGRRRLAGSAWPPGWWSGHRVP